MRAPILREVGVACREHAEMLGVCTYFVHGLWSTAFAHGDDLANRASVKHRSEPVREQVLGPVSRNFLQIVHSSPSHVDDVCGCPSFLEFLRLPLTLSKSLSRRGNGVSTPRARVFRFVTAKRACCSSMT
jgi:hypothetical protein